MSVVQDSGSLASGYVFIAPQDVSAATYSQGPEIMDDLGRIVWFMPMPAGQGASDFRVQTYMGNPVLTWSQSSVFGAVNPVTTVDYIYDSTYSVLATVKAGNGANADMHEFQLTPQNTALIAINDSVPGDLSSVGGPASGSINEATVQEIDVATGAVLLEWHSLKDVPLTDSYMAYVPGQKAPYDYFHINSVKLDADGNILVSSRHTWTVYKINRTTGALIWRMGGKKSDFALGAGLPFAWQHDVEAVDASTLRIFDNESNGAPVMPSSRVIWVHHDDAAMTANVVETITHPALLSTYAEGNAQQLDNGDVFVGWGIIGRFSEFNAEGQLLYDVVQQPGYGSYRSYRFPWAGAPAGLPTATALQASDGTLTVDAVWNGATNVASWQVTGSQGVLASAPWNGFDTAIHVAGGSESVQVVALDALGNTLATSPAVTGPFGAEFPTQPSPQTISAGGTVVFTAEAAGPGNYQWFVNGRALANGTSGATTVSGATGPTLVIRGATAADAGSYTCVSTNFGNSATSDPATLTVGAVSGWLANISCRSAVGTGDAALIVGFALGGQGASGSDPVLIRAAGPALAAFGLSGALPDPDLQLYGASGVIAENDGWAGAPLVANSAAAVGAFPWDSGSSLDAALDQSLAAGTYSAIIAGDSDDTGIVLGEVYDGTPAGLRPSAAPRLVNLSGRGEVGTDDNVLIAGFVVAGTASETLLIRASGPALGAFGVSGFLPDPVLQLFRSNADGTSTPIESNQGWKADPLVAATAASVGAFTWGAAASADSALLVTLPPGAYTAEISGAARDAGISLVEIYEVP